MTRRATTSACQPTPLSRRHVSIHCSVSSRAVWRASSLPSACMWRSQGKAVQCLCPIRADGRNFERIGVADIHDMTGEADVSIGEFGRKTRGPSCADPAVQASIGRRRWHLCASCTSVSVAPGSVRCGAHCLRQGSARRARSMIFSCDTQRAPCSQNKQRPGSEQIRPGWR